MKRKNNALYMAIGALIGTAWILSAANQHEVETETKIEKVEPVAVFKWLDLPTSGIDIKVAEPIPETKTYFDVPLSEELQEHIFAECEKYNIAPAIVISMIAQESNYDSSVIGDDGCSEGLLQIQRKWHEERMERLGCTDLLDAFQNVTVAVDYLAELKDRNSDLYWVMMAYNGGAKYANQRIETGNISNYAIEVVERAAELEGRCE